MTAQQFDELYHEYYQLVYARCRASLGDDEDALDATMEVFARKWVAIDRYDPTLSSFKTWLLSNTYRLCIDLIRKQHHRQTSPLDEAPPADAISPTEREVVETVALSWALDQLDARDRHLLLMKVVDEYTWDEVAALSGLSVHQVRARVEGALRRLRALLECGGSTPLLECGDTSPL